jgi:hypothetical protein
VKAKLFAWLAVVMIATGGLWFGRAAWRAHRQLVTLHVRNAPLAEVLHQIKRQTWQKILTEKAWDAPITLDVRNKRLADVLDRVAEQAGGRWSTVYAVYGSSTALGKLEGALCGEAKLEGSGWTRVAPPTLVLQLPENGESGPIRLTGAGPDRDGPGTGASTGAGVTATEDVTVERPAPGKAGTSEAASNPRPRGPAVVRVVRKRSGDGGSSVEEDVWSPEELVMESVLAARLGSEKGDEATAEAAAQAAGKVHARWATYFVMRKSPLEMGFGGMRPMVRRLKPGVVIRSGNGAGPGGTNTDIAGGIPGLEEHDIGDALRQQRNDELGKLTPEQRVLRARERLSPNSK